MENINEFEGEKVEFIENKDSKEEELEEENEPIYEKTLRYHSDTISQLAFNPNK